MFPFSNIKSKTTDIFKQQKMLFGRTDPNVDHANVGREFLLLVSHGTWFSSSKLQRLIDGNGKSRAGPAQGCLSVNTGRRPAQQCTQGRGESSRSWKPGHITILEK